MTLHAWTTVSLLIGCHVAYSRRQDVFESRAKLDGDQIFSGHASKELRVAHPLSTAMRSMYSVGDGQGCVATCNEDTLPTDAEPQFYECWGDFKWECGVDEPGVMVSSKYTCHGAFTVFPGHHDKQSVELDHMHGLTGAVDSNDKNTSFLMTTCEGSAMTIVKSSVSISADGSEDKENVMSIQGLACIGVSKAIKSNSSEREENYLGCEDVFIAGSATKTSQDSHGTPDSTAEELDRAANHLTQVFTKHGEYSAGMEDTSMPHSGSLAEKQQTSMSDELRAASAAEASAGSGLHSGSELPQEDAWALWGKGHPGCEVTCNGGPLPWHGWWPCRGKTELKCKGEKSGTCYEVDAECLGVAFPAFKTCRGVATQHITVSTGEGSSEVMGISTGKSRVKEAHAHGWKGHISFAMGHSSVHSRNSND